MICAQFVKENSKCLSNVPNNKDGKTPQEVFKDSHNDLINDCNTWLSNISNSCSVVAGLFVTIAFNTSTSVPGGVRDDSGTPYLANQPAFDLFAISSQVAFYSSVVAVVMFLAILTSGYQTHSFEASYLPWKLLLGLTAFYVSIASTLMSFASAHFFVLKANLKHAASPVYLATCLVVTLFAIYQFPLFFHLAWATFKKVPERRGSFSAARDIYY